jgi:hypothetical protein
MTMLKIDGDWITLDDRRVARIEPDLPHWLYAALRRYEGRSAAEARKEGYDDGYAAAWAAALADDGRAE